MTIIEDLTTETVYPRATVDGYILEVNVSCGDLGDARVIAMDGTEACLIWETGSPVYFEQVLPAAGNRCGTFAVQLPLPLTTDDEAAVYLHALLPRLERHWAAVEPR